MDVNDGGLDALGDLDVCVREATSPRQVRTVVRDCDTPPQQCGHSSKGLGIISRSEDESRCGEASFSSSGASESVLSICGSASLICESDRGDKPALKNAACPSCSRTARARGESCVGSHVATDRSSPSKAFSIALRSAWHSGVSTGSIRISNTPRQPKPNGMSAPSSNNVEYRSTTPLCVPAKLLFEAGRPPGSPH